MTTQNVALPVTFFIAVILVMGAYAFWLWLQLWFLQQATRRVRDTIVGREGHDHGGGGCGGFLTLFAFIAIVAGLLLYLAT